MLLPNERFRRSELRGLGVRSQFTGRREEGARCRLRRGERRWNGGRLCVIGVLIFRSDGVCQLGTETDQKTAPEAPLFHHFRTPFRTQSNEEIHAKPIRKQLQNHIRTGCAWRENRSFSNTVLEHCRYADDSERVAHGVRIGHFRTWFWSTVNVQTIQNGLHMA